jgi:hypothetical protein
MNAVRTSVVGLIVACVAVSFSASAIDAKYRAKLERSGCTQVTEAQGCDINKTKEQNARAGFGSSSPSPSHPHAAPAPRYKDLAHQSSINAIDVMTSRGFRSVDSIESGDTQYGIFYHPASRLCVQMTMAEGEVLSVDDIHSHPKCR